MSWRQLSLFLESQVSASFCLSDQILFCDRSVFPFHEIDTFSLSLKQQVSISDRVQWVQESCRRMDLRFMHDALAVGNIDDEP